MAAWRTKPSFYAVSTQDRTINPDLERFMAKRMGAKTIEIEASHLALISHSRCDNQPDPGGTRGLRPVGRTAAGGIRRRPSSSLGDSTSRPQRGSTSRCRRTLPAHADEVIE